jgi:MFS family permease
VTGPAGTADAAAPTPERRIRNPLDPRNPLSGVYLATMLFELAEGGLRFLLPLTLAERGVGVEGIGFVIAVFSFTSLISRGFVGGVFRYDRARRLIVAAGIASTAAFLLLPFGDSVPVYALLMAADGFGWGVATTVLLAVVMTVTPSTMSSAVAMGWYVGFQGIALALATTVAGILAQWLGVQAAMMVLATIPVVAAILISLRLPRFEVAVEPGRQPTVDDGEDEDVSAPGRFAWIRGGFAAARRIVVGLPAAVWAAAIVAVYLNVMNGLLQSFFPLLGIAAGMTLAQVGTLSTIRVGVSSVARFGAGVIFGLVKPRYLHWPLLTMSAMTVVVLPWTVFSYALTVPFLALNGISRGLLRVTTGAAAMDALRGQQAGAAAAVMTAGLDVGKMIGPLLGGIIAGAFGLEVMFVVVPLAFFALYTVFYVAAIIQRRRSDRAALSA